MYSKINYSSENVFFYASFKSVTLSLMIALLWVARLMSASVIHKEVVFLRILLDASRKVGIVLEKQETNVRLSLLLTSSHLVSVKRGILDELKVGSR